MIGSLIFLNSRGDIILSRAFRDNVNIRSLGEAFRTQIIATKLADRSPVKTLGSVSFLHMRHENLYIVATSRANVNAALVFTFLSTMVKIFKAYFGQVVEESVKENFVLVQELIDEIMDFGFPQNTEVDVLKMYITTSGLKSELLTKPKDQAEISMKVTGKINWRKDGIKYRKNEVFIDVVEDVNLLMSQQGTILHRDVSGKVVMKSFLSGMPECKFGLNDKAMLEKERSGAKRVQEIDLEDVTFHQCVRLGKFDTDRTISFIPPDGEFILMKYRTQDNVNPPFRVLSPVLRELGKTRLEIDFKVKAEFNSRLFGTNVIIKVPCPKSTASCKISISTGKAKYEAEHSAIIWRLSEKLEGKNLQVNAAQDEARSLKEQFLHATQALKAKEQELEQQTARMERMQQGVEEITRQVDTSIITSAEATRIQNKYQQEVSRIIKENPNCIPIRCVRAGNCDPLYPLLEKKKFAAPKDMTLSRFNEHIRQKMKLSQDAPLSVYVDSAVPLPTTELLEDIYNFCRGLDGFLHLKYSHVSEQMP